MAEETRAPAHGSSAETARRAEIVLGGGARSRRASSAASCGPGGREGGRKYFPPQEGLQVLRRENRSHQLQRRPAARPICGGERKIVPRRLTGVCTPHQRRLSSAIKQARNIALLPFAGRAS